MIVSFDCPSCDAVVQAELKGLKRRLVNCSSCEKSVQIPEDVGVGPGVIIGNGYELQEKVGDSHVGEIFLASQNGTPVRVEILSGEMTNDEEAVTRFLQEVELLSSLKHPNLLGAIEAGQDNETYFLVTAHEPGMVSLEQYLQKHDGPLSEGDGLKFMTSIAEVLEYTWNERKILHRDIKPQNIFITEGGEAKLSGFTIAKSSEGQSMGLTGVGFTIGTPEYMSPEQIRAAEDLDFRSDLYALGVVLYECLAGELPFVESAPILLMQKHMDEVPVPVKDKNSNISASASALVDKMLAKTPEERFDSWQALITEMKSDGGGGAAAPAKSSAPAASSGASAPAASSGGEAAAPSGGDGEKKPPVAIIAVVVIIIIIILAVAL